jgi:hypothetical protein
MMTMQGRMLVSLSQEEFEQENIGPEDERDYATKMSKLRMEFLAKNVQATRVTTQRTERV